MSSHGCSPLFTYSHGHLLLSLLALGDAYAAGVPTQSANA